MPPVLDAASESYVQRLVCYTLVTDSCSTLLRERFSPNESKAGYDAARRDWDSNKALYPDDQPPRIGTTEWDIMWQKVNAVLSTTPTTAKGLHLKYSTAAFAIIVVVSCELNHNPLAAQIENLAQERAAIVGPLQDPDNDPFGDYDDPPNQRRRNTIPDLLDSASKIHCRKLYLGRPLEFIIVDYGTSHSMGSWVKYLPTGGTEGRDEVTIAADVMDDLLETADIYS